MIWLGLVINFISADNASNPTLMQALKPSGYEYINVIMKYTIKPGAQRSSISDLQKNKGSGMLMDISGGFIVGSGYVPCRDFFSMKACFLYAKSYNNTNGVGEAHRKGWY